MLNQLDEWERKMLKELKEYYNKCKLDAVKCPDDNAKSFYNGKASGANDLAISFFNIDISEDFLKF